MNQPALFVLYVDDQARSAAFYQRTLDVPPSLDVPGMTQFPLTPTASLGLMPHTSISHLLGDALPTHTARPARAELYLRVSDPAAHLQRALDAGATLLSPLQPRDWGESAGYVLDPDHHVLAFAPV